jgi:hypothetical protein
MKKILLALVFLVAISTLYVNETQAFSFAYSHRAVYAHYAQNSSWWTGLGILNTSGTDITVQIVAVDGASGAEAYGTVDLGPGEKATGQLTILLTSGAIPPSGSLFIYGDGPFLVSKFTANTSTTPGFSEFQLKPDSAPGNIVIGQ